MRQLIMTINRPLITVASFISLACNGLALTFIGVSLPALQQHLEIDIVQAGMLMAWLQAGLTVCALLGGFFADRVQREWIIGTGCLSLGLGAVFLCIAPSYAYSLVAASSMGVGLGLILSGTNTLLVSMYTSHKGAILNIHHVFFGVGSIIGPALMGVLIIRGNNWQAGYYGAGLLLFILALIFFFSRDKVPIRGKNTSQDIGSLRELFAAGRFHIILWVNFLSMGSQLVIMLFGVTFLVQAKQCSLGEAGAALSVFSLFIVLGRLACSRLTFSFNHTSIVLTMLWLQVIMLLLIWRGSGWLALAVLAVSGFTFSGMYPTLMALTSMLFPDRDGISLGLLSTMGGLGAIVLCWLTGFVAGLSHIGIGLMVTIVACGLGLIMFQVYYPMLSRWESQSQAAHE
ncbi:MAG: MFS transporter [Desulfofustis sp.]|nr:MFS transporter [Desulfofustis sp.]